MKYIIPLSSFIVAGILSFSVSTTILAQTRLATPSPTPMASVEPTPKPPLTEESKETLGPLEKILEDQELGSVYTNPAKYAIRSAVGAGVPANTIVLLLLLPALAAIIAASRHLIGLRGFGIFLPAALSVVFLATGPIVGIGLFLVIVGTSMIVRWVLRKIGLRLQYLPRMSLILWFVVVAVLGVLFLAPYVRMMGIDITSVSIFPVLILVLLSDDFTRVQLGKSFRVALRVTTETLILGLISYFFLTLEPIQKFVLLNPEIVLGSVAIFDLILGRFIGLRFMEYIRFRRLISN